MNHITLSRLASKTLNEHLRVMPAVVVSGTRQTGKSTLVKEFVPGERRFYTLEDFHILNTAQNDPEALVVGSDPVTLDEVQREPKLLLAVKSAIDRHRQPGQFLLTGSVNFSLMRNISESLAGRASYLALWPMTRREQMGLARINHQFENWAPYCLEISLQYCLWPVQSMIRHFSAQLKHKVSNLVVVEEILALVRHDRADFDALTTPGASTKTGHWMC